MPVKTVKRYDTLMDRRLATAAVVSDRFLRGLRPIFNPSLIDGDLLRTVLEWSLAFYERHRKAPGASIQDIFARHFKRLDPDTAEDVGDFLQSLSREFEEGADINEDYLLEQAEAKLREGALRQLRDDIAVGLDGGDLDTAEQAVTSHKIIRAAASSTVNPFADADAITTAFELASKPLFRMPGALGKIMTPQCTPDAFIALLGPEKVGKTWLLMEMAMRARRAGCNVLFIQAGDLSKPQQVMRFAIRLAGRSNKEQYCGLQRIPVLDCWHNQTGDCEDCTSDGVVEGGDYENPIYTPFSEAEHVPCTKCYGTARFKGSSWWVEREIARLTQEHAIALGAKFDRAIRGRLELLVRPAGTLTVAGIEAALDRLESDSGFVPHVVISDYADIFGPESSRYDEQGNENARWLGLRRVTQERKHCHITATQADADSYTQKTLTKKNFSRDKRKLAHVTAMFGLNQTPAEKALGRLRVNEIVVREDEYDTRKCVTLIQSLQTGRPIVASY